MAKFARTVARDAGHQIALEQLGWRVLIVWECELRDMETMAHRLVNAFHPLHRPTPPAA